jgi:prepilin-type N-terminal cleavage/methylation domain-containing protein
MWPNPDHLRCHRATRRPAALARASAFTLIEMTVVIAMIAILFAVAIPRYADSVNRYRVDMAAKRVAADIGLARTSARSTSLGQTVNFGTPANGYTMPGLAAAEGRSGDYIAKLTDEPFKVKLGAVAFGSPPTTTVQFDRFGYPNTGGTVVVTSGGYSKTIYVDGTTGRTEVR